MSERNEGLAAIPAAAKFLAVSKGKLYMMIQAGECPSRRFGRSVRVPWAWLYAQAEDDKQSRTIPHETNSVDALALVQRNRM